MSYTDIASADVEVLQQTATDMGYDEFAQATNGDLLLKKTEVVGSYTYVTTFNCRTETVDFESSYTPAEDDTNSYSYTPAEEDTNSYSYTDNGEHTELEPNMNIGGEGNENP